MLTQAQRRAFLSALGSADGFEAACAGAGIPPGAVVAERVRNPRFARAWDQHLDACISRLETILLEKATSALATGFPGSDARDKLLVGVVQWLLESRRPQGQRGRAATAGGLPATREAAPVREAASARDAARNDRDDARKIAALIEDARVRLAQSEAQMAKDGLTDWTDGITG